MHSSDAIEWGESWEDHVERNPAWETNGKIRPCACCLSLHEFICPSVLFCLEDTISLECSITCTLRTFPIPLPHNALSLEGRDLMNTSQLRRSALKSHSLSSLSSCGLCIYSHLCQRETVLMWFEQGDTSL